MAVITETMLRSMLARGIPNPYPVAKHDVLTPAAADFLRNRHIPIVEPEFQRSLHRIPVGVSSRHIHLSQPHAQALFGPDEPLTPYKELSQKGQYAAHQTVTLIGPKGEISNVRVLGPVRHETQVEISITDGFQLGLHPPIRLSGDLQGTPGIHIRGSRGIIRIEQGVIAAKRHVHMSPLEATLFGVRHGDVIRVRTSRDHVRSMAFSDVIVRVNERSTLDFHIDTDEANCANLVTGSFVELDGIERAADHEYETGH